MRTSPLKDKVAIVGIGQTEFSSGLPNSSRMARYFDLLASLGDTGLVR